MAFTAGSAIAAGVATMATYATFAGAVLSTFGALSGEKSFQKLGAVLSIGGALSGGFSGMAGADGAKSAADAATAADATSVADGSSLGGMGAQDPGALAGVAGGTPGSGGGVAAGMDPGAMAGVAGGTPGSGAGVAEQFSTPPVIAGQQPVGGAALQAPGAAAPGNVAPLNALEKAGSGIDSNSFNSWFEKAMAKTGSALKSTNEFVNNNKGLVDIGLGAIKGMYGPEAEAADMKRDELNYNRSLMERARENLNSPIRLKYLGSN